MYRQGDVLIVPIARIPMEAMKEKCEKGGIVLAHEEATGHAHVIHDHSVRMFCTPVQPLRRFLRLVNPAKLVHEEHDTVTIPPGDFEVIRQREYTPEEIRYVAD